MKNDKAKPEPRNLGAKDAGVQGEGDYIAAREYREQTKNFIDKHGREIPSLGKDAEKALESGEGAELVRAEEKGKAKARH